MQTTTKHPPRISTFVSDGEVCPEEFLLYQNICLTLPHRESLDWPNAVGKCQDIGGTLPKIHNAGKQEILETFISNHYNASVENIDLPIEYKYHYLDDFSTFIRQEKHITFDVMGCNDAHLILSKIRNDTVSSYEIVFGGWSNTQSVIRTHKQGKAMSSALHSPLSCNTSRPFWVSWENGKIKAGEGKVVSNGTFMEWTDPKPHPVNFIGISSWTTAETHWKFNKAPYNSTFWLSGTDLDHSREWVWFPEKGFIDYTNWLPEEPNYSSSHRHCIQMSLDSDFRWATDNCMLKRNFICELDTNSISKTTLFG
ncbi:uncharacterized protein LOC133202836 [Saccostrea echinata]|uniref:uncharacterized protein LOC133202836 n=1 Tax=Saccostrea echinata TaxID=191078 RepID=UPI002A810C01|nr:uncharacterized protein LOC133202836 [Saccostrea echinata]